MEAGTAATHSTGSKTIADLMARAAEQFAGRVALRHKVDGAWRDVTYAEVGEIVRGSEGIVDRLDPRRPPASGGQEPFQVPLPHPIRIDVGPGFASEPVRRQADQRERRPPLERSTQEGLVAVVEDVERPSEDDAHPRRIRPARYKRD